MEVEPAARALDELADPWNDLEDVCVGPVHWDVAGLVVEACAPGGSEAFVAEFLRAYGGPDLGELHDFIAAHLLYTSVWQAFAAQRRRP